MTDLRDKESRRLIMLSRSLYVILGLAFISAPSASAQPRTISAADSFAIVSAVLRHAKQDMRMSGTLRIVDYDKASRGVRDSAQTAALGALIGAKMGLKKDLVVCDTKDCHMDPALTLVSVSDITFEGDTALVRVANIRATGIPRMPIGGRENIYEVVQRDGQWIVVGLRASMAS
jgi:hypothetical protein